MSHILLVDDDIELCEMLCSYLESESFSVTLAHDGESALASIKESTPDLVLLDTMMPKKDGVSVLKILRQSKDSLPVIMLTAKTDDIDRILGLELGADDYIGKPCNPREIVARINAVLRRATKTEKYTDEHIVTHASIYMDSSRRLLTIDEQEIALTTVEFDMLFLLLKNKGQVVHKDVLFQEVLGREGNPFDRSVDVHVSRLRKKLDAVGMDIVKTIRGKGYQLT